MKKIISLVIALCFLSSMLLLAPALTVNALSEYNLKGTGVVDIRDAIIMSMVFGMTNSSPYWNEMGFLANYSSFKPSMADFGNYGVINILDVIILAQNFGT